MTRRIPASKCPSCEQLHQFNNIDMSDARRARPLGPGAVLVCTGCAAVNKLATNLTLEPVSDLSFIASDPIRAERWRVVELFQIDAPKDLVLDTARAAADANDGEILVIGSGEPEISVVSVEADPDDPDDHAYVQSVVPLDCPMNFVITGVYPAAAELTFRVIYAAWPAISDAGIGPSQPFTFDSLAGYQYVFAPLDDPGLLQVLWQDPHDRWPWEQPDPPVHVFAGPDWRPFDVDPVTVEITRTVPGMLTGDA